MSRWIAAVALVLVADAASAACVNRFVQRRESTGHWLVTLLTGRMTFQEAQKLARDIDDKRAPPIEWVDDKGKTIARQLGPLKVMRPMPVACEGKASGVIMLTTFLASKPPSEKMTIKLDPSTTVVFDEQKD